MKKSKEILRDPPPDFRLYLALTMVVVGMALIVMGSVACAQDVSLQIEVSDPDASGTMHLKGNVVCTDLHPEGQQIVTNDVLVHVEYMMDDGGKWPIFYEWWNHAYKCYWIDERCITDEERYGVHVQGGGTLLSKSLEDSDAGKSFSFEKDLKPPTNATRARVVAHLRHTYTSGAAYWDARQHLWDSASFDILLPNPDSDGDGVPDKIDKCPKTPPDTIVDDNGCPAKYDCDDNYVCDHDKGENCAICPKECPCNPGEKCDPSDPNADPWGCVAVAITDSDGDGVPDGDDQCPGTPAGVAVDDKGCPVPIPADSDGDGVPDGDDQCLGTPAGVAVDDKGCPIEMQLNVSTDKKIYSPEETVIIRGSVWDAKGGLDGATVTIDVDGTKYMLTTTTDSSGNYKENVALPSDISQGKHTVTVTASKTGYPAVSGTTSFSVEQALIVEISTDQLKCESLLSLIGKNERERKKPKIYSTITVKDAATGNLVPYANLKVITTRLCTRKATELSGATDGIGENTWSFTLEERLKIEVTASRDGYSDGHKSIIFPEDCFWSPEVCKCGANRICDPWSEYADLFGCSPKMAYVMVNPANTISLQRWLWGKYIKEAISIFEMKGYKVVWADRPPKIDYTDILSNPSTKAIAYFGHAPEPGIGGVAARDIHKKVKPNLKLRYRKQGMDEKEADARANEDARQLDLDYAYIYSCHSLDDTSLADYLLHSGGVYWGERGVLLGWGAPLEKYVKP